MKAGRVSLLVALVFGLGVAFGVGAEGEVRNLPTLLIKGTVESINPDESGALLLKVKDRYGFETPIYLNNDVQVTQADQQRTLADVKPGSAVEVEYNFDVNTAKRQGVVVVIADPLAGAPAVEQPAATPQQAPAVGASPVEAAPEAAPATPEATQPAQ
jgi:hypothetical protein